MVTKASAFSSLTRPQALPALIDRLRPHRKAVIAALMGLSLLAFVVALALADAGQGALSTQVLHWVLLPIIISSLFLSLQGMALLTVFNIIGLLLVGVLRSAVLPAPGMWPSLLFIMVAALLVMVCTNARRHYLVQAQLEDAKQTQRKLQKINSELQAANREVRNFAYIIAHDLRAPLVNMVGFMDEVRLALKTLTPVLHAELPNMEATKREQARRAFFEELPEAIDYVEISINKMEYLIEQVLKLSQLGQRQLHPHPIEVTPLVNEIIDTMTYELDKKGTWTTVHPLPDVIADPVAFLQIMSNLIDNAIKYLDPDRPGMIEIWGESTEDETIYHIKDNGRGIADADKAKVFQLFRRVGSAKGIRGKGMGLAYVQTLVQRHGGRVWFESEFGQGSTFSFSISNALKIEP